MQYLLRTLLFIYPVVAHVAILMDQIVFAVIYLLSAIYVNNLRMLFSRSLLEQGVVVSLFAVLSYLLLSTNVETWVIYLPPVLIPAWLAYVFIQSLFGDKAFITQIAERMEDEPLGEQQIRYTKRVTALWGFVFLAMIVEAVSLAIWAPFDVWSWWAHIGNYVIIAILFLIEIVFRYLLVGRPMQLRKMLQVSLRKKEK